MRVFISYHRQDTKYKNKLMTRLEYLGYQCFAIPENHFDGKNHQAIATELVQEVGKCDVLICLVGVDTFSRPHVDNEIHVALKGAVGTRKGIVAIMLENRSDSKKNIDEKTFPV